MSEKLGNWHFWLTVIGLNLAFFPMHFSGLLGMARRIYRYDAGQGWETFNFLSSIGAYILGIGTLIGVINFFRSMRRGERVGNDPWGGPNLEWTIPSPPPEYNFATLPTVTSRYPMWDMRSPHLTSQVPHSPAGEAKIAVQAAGREVGEIDQPEAHGAAARTVGTPHVETRVATARELGIPMPSPTMSPLWTALGLSIMVGGTIFMDNTWLGLGVILSGAALMVGSLYNWLLTPLEAEH